MKKYLPQIVIAVFIIFGFVLFFWKAPVENLQQIVLENSAWSVLVFVFLMIVSTVFAPLTVLPMVPFVSLFLGPFNTAVYSVAGWLIGSMIAFWIARYAGRPALLKFVPEKDIEKYQKYVPNDISFWWLVFLRVTIPVDVLSYLVGLLTNMSSGKYFLATLIGVIPFSFIFAYGYNIVFFENKVLSYSAIIFILAMAGIFAYLKKKKRKIFK